MILDKYKYFDYKPFFTPYDPTNKLLNNNGDSNILYEYAIIIESHMYTADCNIPIIVYVIGLLCRPTRTPSIESWNSIERVKVFIGTSCQMIKKT